MSNAEEKNDKESREERSIPTVSSLGPEGETIGQIRPYKLLRVLGEGGCGVVYLAQQERPVKRRVALKVIKPGMDSKQVIGRLNCICRRAVNTLDAVSVMILLMNRARKAINMTGSSTIFRKIWIWRGSTLRRCLGWLGCKETASGK